MTDISGSNSVSDGYNQTYTPTTEEVYRAHWRGTPMRSEDGLREHVALDRWLAEVKAQVWDECSYAYMGKIFETAITGEGILRLNNPYLQGEEQ